MVSAARALHTATTPSVVLVSYCTLLALEERAAIGRSLVAGAWSYVCASEATAFKNAGVTVASNDWLVVAPTSRRSDVHVACWGGRSVFCKSSDGSSHAIV